MYIIDHPPSDRLEPYAALDIETDGLDGAEDTLVAIGVGFADGTEAHEVKVHTLAEARGDELRLIERAVKWLDDRQPAGFVTYNGDWFDLPFLEDKLESHGVEGSFGFDGRHVDLFAERKRLASEADEKWPSLEQCLEAAGLPVADTEWDGDLLTNKRFGEELAPRYLRALETMEFDQARALEAVIREYTRADIEATMALYEADLAAGSKATPQR